LLDVVVDVEVLGEDVLYSVLHREPIFIELIMKLEREVSFRYKLKDPCLPQGHDAHVRDQLQGLPQVIGHEVCAYETFNDIRDVLAGAIHGLCGGHLLAEGRAPRFEVRVLSPDVCIQVETLAYSEEVKVSDEGDLQLVDFVLVCIFLILQAVFV